MPRTTTFDRSVTIKLGLIGLIVLVLLIPALMIADVIYDRAQLADEARSDIMHSWGRNQTLTGPILLVPWQRTVYGPDRKPAIVSGTLAHMPTRASVVLEVNNEVRYRGLYTVPVYTARAGLDADFDPIDLSALGLPDAELMFDRARIAVGLSDLRTLREAPVLHANNEAASFGPGVFQDATGLRMIDVAASALGLDPARQTFTVQTELDFAGTDQLDVVPVGDNQRVSMTAQWPDPSFTGQYLPGQRTVSESGFDASWAVTSLGRGFGSTLMDTGGLVHTLHTASLGVTFKPRLNTYDRARRAVRYAALAIALTFACFFLFDVLGALGLHAVQYLLIGCANCLFFLLLISLAEHVGFATAYGLSSVASISLIAGYSAAVLGAAWRAGLCALALGATYGFIYMTLGAQTYALLAGSLGLWGVLAGVMYLTRHVDWRSTMAGPAQDGAGTVHRSADGLATSQRV
ncbi:MAG: cell envelope integrity protein CreD [Pseudomonadota bacterium]